MAPDPGAGLGRSWPGDEPRPPSEARERAVYAFEHYAESILGFIGRLLQDRHDAEALAQEVFLRLLVEKGSFAAEGKLRSWLYRVARNLSLDHLKKQRAKPVGAALDLLLPAKLATDSLEERELLEAMHRSLGELPPLLRSTVVMRFLEGLSYEEIAEIEAVSQSALRTRIQKGIELLRVGMSAWLDLTAAGEEPGAARRTVEDQKRSEALQ